MKIEITISSSTLGDFNTDEDNRRYVEAVGDAIKLEYPGASVSVGLVDNVTESSIYCSNDREDENIGYIIDRVWNEANY